MSYEVAEREGFEPSVPRKGYNGFRVRLRPSRLISAYPCLYRNHGRSALCRTASCFTSHSIPRRSFAPRLQTIPYAEVWDSFHLGVSSGPNRPVLCRGPIPLFRCRRKKNSGPFHPRQLHAAVDSLSQTENPGIRISAGRARNSARRRLAHGLAGECGGRQASPGRARRRPPGQSSSRGSCGAGGRCAAQVSAALRRSGKAQASMMSLTSSCRSALNVWYHCHSAS
jgi:hypothetical protein